MPIEIFISYAKLNIEFQGDLQQLTIVDNPQAAYELCTDYVPDCNQPLPSLTSSSEEVIFLDIILINFVNVIVSIKYSFIEDCNIASIHSYRPNPKKNNVMLTWEWMKTNFLTG